MESKKEPTVYIILLNWNGWKDTIECLESIYKLSYQSYKVIVCDNQSADGSIEFIKKWADGGLQCQCSSNEGTIRNKVLPYIKKPLMYRELSINDIDSMGQDTLGDRLILLHTGGNLGFAGGCNIGIVNVFLRF